MDRLLGNLRWKTLGLLTAVTILLVAAPAVADPAPTITSPANGQTVSLTDATFHFGFTMSPQDLSSWTLWIGNQPTYDPSNNFQPFAEWCSGQNPASSCLGDVADFYQGAGTHYAVLQANYFDGSQPISPEVHYTVPTAVGFGCVPSVGGCGDPTVTNQWAPHGNDAYGYANTDIAVYGWSNTSSLRMAYTLKHGHRVLKRWQRSISAGSSFYPDNTFVGQIPVDGVELVICHLRGIATGTKLQLAVTLSSGSASSTRTYAVRAGGGPRYGVETSAGYAW